MARKKDPKNYVDNKLLFAEMVKYKELYDAAKAAGAELPKVNNYIGECVWLIANRLSTNRNFIGYSYRDEMIGDGIENCLRYLHNFNPEKYNNPFAYFTQIIYYAFLRRIEKEHKQTYIKYKVLENDIITNNIANLPAEDRTQFNVAIDAMTSEKMHVLSDKFEGKKIAKKAAKKGVEKFVEEDEQPLVDYNPTITDGSALTWMKDDITND